MVENEHKLLIVMSDIMKGKKKNDIMLTRDCTHEFYTDAKKKIKPQVKSTKKLGLKSNLRKPLKYSLFNDKYEMTKLLGTGETSRVFLC